MRSTLRISILLATVLVFTVSCGSTEYLRYSSNPAGPATDGQIDLAGLHSPVKVTYDSHHVPHIIAQNDDDLWFAVGWVQARERLFQMDILRRMASGRMCELLGSQDAPEGMPFKDLMGMDRFFRVMGLAQDSEHQTDALAPESRAVVESYIAGINAYILSDEPISIEYGMIQASPVLWTATDVLTVARLTTFELSTNFPWELMRFLLAATISPEAQEDIFPGKPQWGPNIVEKVDHDFTGMPRLNPDPMQNALSSLDADGVNLADWVPAATGVLELLGRVQENTRPYFNQAASNSWAVSGSHTASGKPILANDPHLLHGAPSTFILMHLNAPGIDAIGAILPGTPFLTLGRNQHIGWAATNTFADVQDIYLEKLDPTDPTRYMTEYGPEPFRMEKHVISVRVGTNKYVEHPFYLRYTRHGPVLNDSLIEGLPVDAQPITLKTAAVWPSDEAKAINKWIRATSVKEYFAALEHWGLPIQNWVAVDDLGHIGYFPAGLVPLRTSFDGTVPVPGWTGEYEWQGHIPFDQLPKMYDPPSGIIVTANNQVVPADDYPYPYSIDTMPGYRAARIREVLSARKDWTGDEFRVLHTDTYVKEAERLMPFLFKALETAELNDHERQALDALKAWDKMAEINSVGASIFFATYREAWKLGLDDDLPLLFKRMVRIFSVTYAFFDSLWADRPGAKVWDMKATAAVEDRDEVLRLAFKAAVKKLDQVIGHDINTWQWGKLHTITFHHPFGKSVPGSSFDVGPVATPGSWETVWAAGGGFWGDNDKFPVSEGPAFRHVMDFSEPEKCNMVLDLGQSGWPMTPEYSNAFDDWNHGRLWQLSMDPAVFSQGAEGELELTPVRR